MAPKSADSGGRAGRNQEASFMNLAEALGSKC